MEKCVISINVLSYYWKLKFCLIMRSPCPAFSVLHIFFYTSPFSRCLPQPQTFLGWQDLHKFRAKFHYLTPHITLGMFHTLLPTLQYGPISSHTFQGYTLRHKILEWCHDLPLTHPYILPLPTLSLTKGAGASKLVAVKDHFPIVEIHAWIDLWNQNLLPLRD